MSWKALVQSLIKTPTKDDIKNTNRGESLLKEVADAEPSIYWHPSEGHSRFESGLNRLALDPPNNPTGRRIFPLKGDKADAQPLLLWMNNIDDDFWDFPGAVAYSNEQFSVQIKVEGAPCRYVIPTKLYDAQNRNISIPLAVFQVRVTGGKPKRHERPKGGDLYTVLFSAAESDMLISCVLAPHRLRVEVVALIREGCCGCVARNDFTIYQDVPRRLAQYQASVGRVEYFLVDQGLEILGYKIEGTEVNGISMKVPTSD